ncbi:MAG TPA: SIS domain-containing protein [Xanthobacteraceae bacterium]|nr:SIS domain-containing protein [Xanthobacteraceae bacterium]
MDQHDRQMATEFREAPVVVRRQAEALAAPLAELAARLRRRPPDVVVTCARGSSAHAATFGKHLFERHLGIVCAPAAPNIASVYRTQMRLKDQLFLSISQSGRSDDLVESARMAKASGAITVAMVNDTASPLAVDSDIVLPIGAGLEHSVAATKTFVGSLAALLRLTAAWTEDADFAAALEDLPDRLAAASDLDWSIALDALAAATSLLTLGRGPTLAIAREAALKFKETCDLPAEPFSGAEFMHGPVSLVDTHYPVLIFMPTDAAAKGLAELAADLGGKGASVFFTGTTESAGNLPSLSPEHPEADAICLIQSLYGLLVMLAGRRGTNVDQPRHLRKVTRTR